ncbi:hypothetical protein ACHAWF_018285 [Thalassiosira exigua]
MWVFNDAETQISREGKRYKIPSDIATLSCFVNQCLDTEDSTDGSDTDRNNGKGGEVVHEIPLYAINSFVLAEIVKYMECYKRDPMREIVTPFTSTRIRDFVQEEYAVMVDVDQNALFELHAAADYLGIQPLLKLTSLAILLRYMWVGVYISNFGRNCDKLRLNSSFIT